MPYPNLTYSGQSLTELLALEPTHHPIALADALAKAIEHGAKGRDLTQAEETVVASNTVEREVGAGGFHLFFVSSTRRWAPVAVAALTRARCLTKAAFTQDAIDALNLPELTPEAIARVVLDRTIDLREGGGRFSLCDQGFHRCEEDVPMSLIAYIKANRAQFPT